MMCGAYGNGRCMFSTRADLHATTTYFMNVLITDSGSPWLSTTFYSFLTPCSLLLAPHSPLLSSLYLLLSPDS